MGVKMKERDEIVMRTIQGVKMKCRVRIPYISSGHIDFNAEGDQVTWISETGYRSYFFYLDEEIESKTSEELVDRAIKDLMEEKGITEQPIQHTLGAY